MKRSELKQIDVESLIRKTGKIDFRPQPTTALFTTPTTKTMKRFYPKIVKWLLQAIFLVFPSLFLSV